MTAPERPKNRFGLQALLMLAGALVLMLVALAAAIDRLEIGRDLHWLGHVVPSTLVVVVMTGVAARFMHQREQADARLQGAQEQLKYQLSLNASMREMAPVAMCITDPQGRFLMVNRSWEVFTGKRRADVLGRRNVDFLSAEEAAVYDEHDQQLLAEGGEVRFEHVMGAETGMLRNVQVHKAALMDDTGTVLGLLAVKLDVTDFRRAQSEAESASRAKSEFIANMSHELRTPLQSILGFSELGVLRSAAQPKLQAMFQDVYESGARMLNLVNDLLDASKMESTVGSFHFEVLDLRSCVAAVIHELEPLLARKRIELHLSDAQDALRVKVDERRIEQVIRNIVANAIKFTPEASRISVATRLDAQARRTVLTVRDQGPGIPEEERDAIFEPFVQSSRTQQVAGGTGLGLAISKKILDAHGGSICSYNGQAGGAVFEISLPLEGDGATA